MSRFISSLIFCLFTHHLKAQVTCDDALECVGDKLSGSISSRGYKSTSGSTTSITSSTAVAASGDRSAFEINSISSDGSTRTCNAFGSHATFGAVYQNAWTINAFGAAAAANAQVTGNGGMGCHSAQSCYGASTVGARLTTIWCVGSEGIRNMIIETSGTGETLTIGFAGYLSGYNTIVTVKSGDSLRAICYGSGCFGTYIICETGSNCNIQYTRNVNNLDYRALTDLSTPLPDIPAEQADWALDTIAQGIINDNNCNDVDAITFDDFGSPAARLITSSDGGNICCRAEDSCQSTWLQLTNGGDAVCGGFESCLSGFIDMSASTGVIEDGGVYCHGYRSCYETVVYGNGGDNSVVSCGAREGCYGATIRDVNKLYLHGVQSFREATAYGVKNIYVGADVAVFNAEFHTNGVGVMNAYFIQAFAGNRATFYCERGDFCKIFCQTDWSCINMVVNAVCGNYEIDCDYTSSDWRCPTVNDDTSFCPRMCQKQLCFVFVFVFVVDII